MCHIIFIHTAAADDLWSVEDGGGLHVVVAVDSVTNGREWWVSTALTAMRGGSQTRSGGRMGGCGWRRALRFIWLRLRRWMAGATGFSWRDGVTNGREWWFSTELPTMRGRSRT